MARLEELEREYWAWAKRLPMPRRARKQIATGLALKALAKERATQLVEPVPTQLWTPDADRRADPS